MPEIPREIREKLPEGFDDDFEPIEPKDIKVNDYITYFTKPMKYQSGTEKEPELKKGGFISFLPNEDEQLSRKGNKDRVYGFRQFGTRWSVNEKNVWMFFKTKKNVDEILKKEKLDQEVKEAKAVVKRGRKRKVPAEFEEPLKST